MPRKKELSNEGTFSPIKVVIADDHRLFRKGFRWLFSLEGEVVVVGEAEKGDEVGKIIKNTKPDVLLLDLKIPDEEVVQIMSEVYQNNPTTKNLILTTFSQEESILNLAKGGARGYVLKGVDSLTLIQAIKTVYGGVFG